MNADEKAVADVQVPLWDAINRYATTCGGDPSQHVYGNTPRMAAVADTNRVIHNLAARIRAEASGEVAATHLLLEQARDMIDSMCDCDISQPCQHDVFLSRIDAAMKGDA